MNPLQERDGFTLVEVLVATAIMLIAVLAISTLLLQGYRIMGSAGKRSVALHQAQEEMEEAITGSDFDYEDVEVAREPHELSAFEEKVDGTLVTVKRVYGGEMGGQVTYSYFVVDGGPD